VGFDDFDLASVMSPPLTMVAQSPVELTRRSMSLLLERIRDAQTGEGFSPAKIVLPVKLVIRQSGGPHEAAGT
jgi:LacI family transcriptional regulator